MTDKELMALMLYGECRSESQFGNHRFYQEEY